MKTLESLEHILEKITCMRRGQNYEGLKNISLHIQNMEYEKYNFIILRLKKQIEIVKKYNPPVRPAMDPMVSSYLGLYSGLDFPEEYGLLMGYPKCCIESFKSARFAIDNNHLKEVEEIKENILNGANLNNNLGENNNYAIVLTSGFIPCSLKCRESWSKGLIALVSFKEYKNIVKLERELLNELPHYHGGYNEYFEKIFLKK